MIEYVLDIIEETLSLSHYWHEVRKAWEKMCFDTF